MRALIRQPAADFSGQLELCFDVKKADAALLDGMPEWMRPDQVAKVLGGCSRETVRILRNKGQLVCRDFRTPDAQQPCWRFYRDSVREYLAKRPFGETEY